MALPLPNSLRTVPIPDKEYKFPEAFGELFGIKKQNRDVAGRGDDAW